MGIVEIIGGGNNVGKAATIFNMAAANRRKEETHDQQKQMNELKLEEQGRKNQRNNELDKMREDMVNAQTPEDKKKLEERIKITHPEEWAKTQKNTANATTDQLNKMKVYNNVWLNHTTAIDASKGNPQKQEAIYQNALKMLDSSGADMSQYPKTFQEAEKSGKYEVFKSSALNTTNQINKRLKERQLDETKSYRNQKIEEQRYRTNKLYGIREQNAKLRSDKEKAKLAKENTYKPVVPRSATRKEANADRSILRGLKDKYDIDIEWGDGNNLKAVRKEFSRFKSMHRKHPLPDVDISESGEDYILKNLHMNPKDSSEYIYKKKTGKDGKPAIGILFLLKNNTHLDPSTNTVTYRDTTDFDNKNKGEPKTKKIKVDKKVMEYLMKKSK